MLTIDAVINGLSGTPADLTGLTGTAIRWGIAARRGGPRLATLSLTPNAFGSVTLTAPTLGRIRIQFEPTLPPAVPDPFKAKSSPYWHECEVDLPEVDTTQFWGPVLIEPSIFAELV